jgi:ankyrin repeat protein
VQTDIFTAAREGKLDALSGLIKADASLANATNQFGQTPLRVAVMAHQTNAVAFLEQHGARWDAVSAVLAGNATVLRNLLAAQPGEMKTNYYGRSLLHLAAANGDVECVKILLAAQANIRRTDLHGLSPLGVALQHHQTQVVKLLQQQGAEENVFDAAWSGDVPAATALIHRNQSLATATNSTGVSVLDIAAGTGDDELVALLLRFGASAKAKRVQDGLTALHLAAIYNQTNAARLLLRHGARIDVVNDAGFTPLHLAIICGAEAMVEFLLKNNADVNQVMTNSPAGRFVGRPMGTGPNAMRFKGESALHLAAAMCQTNMVPMLLAAGASVNAADSMGRTPLDLAYFAGWTPNAFWLGRTSMRLDPLGLGKPAPIIRPAEIRARQKEVIRILRQAGGKSRSPQTPYGMPFRIP